MNRKQRRAHDKKQKKSKTKTTGFEGMMDLFDKIPESCMTCLTPFDKKSKQMAATWNVVVRKAEKKVNIYCPDCWGTAKRVIADYNRKAKDE